MQNCLICNGDNFKPFLENCPDLYLNSGLSVNYWRCANCNLVQQYPLPNNISLLYDGYPVHGKKSRLYTLMRRWLMSDVYLNPSLWGDRKKLLDYGCGDGWYLAWCKEKGLDVCGFEPSLEHAKELNIRLEIPIYYQIDDILSTQRGSFDIVTLNFVIEHLINIKSVFRVVSDLTKSGGVIRYVVPNIDSWEFKLFGKHWHSLDPPRHISFPGVTHAQKIADDFGLTFLREEFIPFPNGFGGSIPTTLFGHFNSKFFLGTLPISLLITHMFPHGNKAYWFKK